MKRAISLFLVLCLCIGFCACGSNDAEAAQVQFYLQEYGWYRFVGGNYDMEEIYLFNSNGTYKNYIQHSLPSLDQQFQGTYSINTKKQTITLRSDSGGKFKWTYVLSSNSMTLFNSSSQKFIMIQK